MRNYKTSPVVSPRFQNQQPLNTHLGGTPMYIERKREAALITAWRRSSRFVFTRNKSSSPQPWTGGREKKWCEHNELLLFSTPTCWLDCVCMFNQRPIIIERLQVCRASQKCSFWCEQSWSIRKMQNYGNLLLKNPLFLSHKDLITGNDKKNFLNKAIQIM